MESFFALEPTKSYRDYFNVHMVYAVSRDAYIGFGNTNTALEVYRSNDAWFDPSQAVYRKLSEYYRLPVSSGVLIPVVGVVINNIRGGLTYMNSYELKPCFAFTGLFYGERGLTWGTFIHETTGHGFGLLGDEYEIWYDPSYFGPISESDKRALRNAQNKGWELNLSLSNDPSQVTWSHLIGHSRFPYVGINEGGYYYPRGVWRSENESVMRSSESVHYFNTASRELIVKRIMKISGEEYTFEKFLAKDKDTGRPGTRSASTWQPTRQSYEYYHQPPIMGE